MTLLSALEWDRFIEQFPDAHLLQTSAWGELKSNFGWDVQRVQVDNCGAQILFRPLLAGARIAYIPKGPVGGSWSNLWPEVDRVCRKNRSLLLKVEPDLKDQGDQKFESQMNLFSCSAHPVQPRRTILINLEGSEEDWLARMKQKTRYNIRLAEKKGVVVRASDDVGSFYRLMMVTGQRDGFGVHSQAYFQKAFELFHHDGSCELLTAEYDSRLLAGVMIFMRGKRAWYFYGASNDEERNRMPAYLLQWQAMRWAKSRGCTSYDLWGVPDEEEDVLEAGFETRSDGLWGVYRFKRGFGGSLVRSAGAWDKPYLPLIYPLYRWWSARRGEAG